MSRLHAQDGVKHASFSRLAFHCTIAGCFLSRDQSGAGEETFIFLSERFIWYQKHQNDAVTSLKGTRAARGNCSFLPRGPAASAELRVLMRAWWCVPEAQGPGVGACSRSLSQAVWSVATLTVCRLDDLGQVTSSPSCVRCEQKRQRHCQFLK